MGNILSEGLQYIGRIDDDGYVFDRSGSCVAKIHDSGYIVKVGGGESYGKIDVDGAIRNSFGSVVGRIQADGYVYIHSNRVCKVSSSFIERITPKAWNAGQVSTYSGRANYSTVHEGGSSSAFSWPFRFGTTLKLIIGFVLGLWFIIDEGGSIGFVGCLLAIPLMIAIVFIVCGFIKLFIS